ncbi:MAG TPA: hypothetical protein VM755_00305 [Stellaceae bacterium]|nr:hypothetical protein [Stellaceae bacterium]
MADLWLQKQPEQPKKRRGPGRPFPKGSTGKPANVVTAATAREPAGFV